MFIDHAAENADKEVNDALRDQFPDMLPETGSEEDILNWYRSIGADVAAGEIGSQNMDILMKYMRIIYP